MGLFKVRRWMSEREGYADLVESSSDKQRSGSSRGGGGGGGGSSEKMPTPRRVLIDVPRKSPEWERLARSDAPEILEAALACVKKALKIPPAVEVEPLLLMKHVWTTHIHVVFDIFNDDYDFASAHLPAQNDLDVWVVRFAKSSSKAKAWEAPPFLQSDINMRIADAHNLNGWDTAPPFFENHIANDVPYYPQPRESCLLRAANTLALQI